MNKKIILLSAITVLMQPFIHSALMPTGTALTKGLPPIKVLEFNLPDTTTKPAISMPMVKLTPAQIETFTSDLAQVGGKEYLPQIQTVWETNPEVIYSAQRAIQNGDLNARREYTSKIMKLAKELASKKPANFNVQDAITYNSQLEKLINTELSENLFNIRTTMGNMATTPVLINESGKVKKDFYILQNDFGNLQNTIQEIINDINLTPQKAAYKIGELINKFFDPVDDIYNTIKIAESTAINAENTMVRQAMNRIKDLLEKTKDVLESTKTILQKTAPIQARSATYPELKNFAESINAQTERTSSLQPTTPGEITNPISIPTEIKPFFEAQKASINTHIVKLASTMKQLFIQDIPALDLLPREKQIFDLEKVNITTNIKVFNKVLNNIKGLSDNPNAINEFKIRVEQLSVVVTELTNSLEKLTKETKHLLPSKQKAILEGLQGMIREILAIYSDAKTTLLVLEEAHLNKEVMIQIKQNLDLSEFTVKTAKDLATVKETAQELAHILTSKADLLKTDKAPASMLEVFESKMATYLTTFEELKTISKVEDLGALQVKLKEQEKDLLTTLDSLFSKLSWLPTSTTKNEALDAFRKLKSEFIQNKKSIDDLFAKAESIQEKHTFVIIKKNELEMGMLTILDKSKALRMSIKKTIPADKLTSLESEALSKLDQTITEELAALKKIQNAQTSFEVNQLTTVYTPKWEETLRNTLNLFGLKIVLGLTATGVVTWLVQPKDKEEQMTDSIIPEIKDVDVSSLLEAQTEEEFQAAVNKIRAKIEHLNQVPTANLDKAVRDLEMNMKILNFATFKKEAQIFWTDFSTAINDAISDAKLKFNQYRVTKLEQLKYWAEKNIYPLLETKLSKGTKLPKNNEFKSEYEAIIALLKKYIK